MAIVVDCSVAASWALADERTDWTSAALQATVAEQALVPSLFWYEIRNILVINERRSRINQTQTSQFLTDLEQLISVDIVPVESHVLDLARSQRLTVYDASYLELARRTAMELCTLDNQLIVAAGAVGVRLWRP